MRHVGGLRGIDQHFTIGAKPHAFRLNTNRHVRDDRALFNIDDGDKVVVFVGDIKRLAVWMQDQKFRIWTRGQCFDELKRSAVIDLHDVVVARAHDEPFTVLRRHDTARTLANFDCFDDFQLLAVDDRNRVVLLVGDIDCERLRS